MAASKTRNWLQSIGLILLFTIQPALSAQSNGILSSLYKKAAQENRPLILVLDNARNNAQSAKSRDIDDVPNSVEHSSKNYYEHSHTKQSTFDNERDDKNLLPFLLLQNLGQENSEIRNQPKIHKSHDHISRSHSRSRLRARSRDRRQRLRSRIIDDNDNRDRRDRDRRDHDLDHKDNRDDEHDHNVNSIKAFISKNLKDEREPHEKERDDARDRALRTSVIKKLLRYSNDLNCDAQDECADDCEDKYNGNKKDDCEDRCEKKYECDDDKGEESGCDLGDSCGEEETNISTRGERLVTEKDTCKRC